MKMIEKLIKEMKENKASVVFAFLTVLVFAIGAQFA